MITSYRPTSAGRRISSVDKATDVTTKRPLRTLRLKKGRRLGRGSSGKITVRHRGGGAARVVRLIDFRQARFDIPARIVEIEYDPNRRARLARLHYRDGVKAYMVAPVGAQVGDDVIATRQKGDVKNGSRFMLQHIPIGLQIYNIEIEPGRGGQLVRAAGATAQLVAVEGPFATVKLPSGEMRRIPKECMATVGQVSNPDARLVRWGKAGRTRHRGIRPTVRGKAMNPVDHPHGGGEGRNPIGLKNPKTPTGKPALGVKTRRKQGSDRFIVARRKPGRFVGSHA